MLASLHLKPGAAVRLDVPPGTYKIDDAARGSRVSVAVEAERRSSYVLTPEGARGVSGERSPQPPPGPSKRRPVWKMVVAPVLSSVVPGLGQMINREPAKGLGYFVGTVALGLGAVMLTQVDRGTDVSTKGLNGGSFGTEAITATGFGLLTGALHLLYAAQIMDAHAVGVFTVAGLTKSVSAISLLVMPSEINPNTSFSRRVKNVVFTELGIVSCTLTFM